MHYKFTEHQNIHFFNFNPLFDPWALGILVRLNLFTLKVHIRQLKAFLSPTVSFCGTIWLICWLAVSANGTSSTLDKSLDESLSWSEDSPPSLSCGCETIHQNRYRCPIQGQSYYVISFNTRLTVIFLCCFPCPEKGAAILPEKIYNS